MQMHTDPSRQIECYDFWENNNITYKHQGEYSTHVYTQKAEEIIEEHARTEVSDVNVMHIYHALNNLTSRIYLSIEGLWSNLSKIFP